jgi:hypothetical protein
MQIKQLRQTRGTFAGGKVRGKVFGEELESALDRRARHCDQVAKALAFVEREDFSELLQHRLPTLPLLNLLQEHRKRIRFHAARRALPARLRHKEL